MPAVRHDFEREAERKEQPRPEQAPEQERGLGPREQLASAVGNSGMQRVAARQEHDEAERDLVGGAPMSSTANAFAPEPSGGDELVQHELAHTTQQGPEAAAPAAEEEAAEER
jgi:hypothetical protein